MTTTAGTTVTTDTNQSLKRLTFSWPDYLVFAISLAIPLGIGVFFFFYKRSQQSTESFLVGDRSINFVAVALSVLMSLLNGIFVVGTPAEIHYFGTEIAMVVVGIAIGAIAVAHLFIPHYQRMKFTSAYEYVERRFNYPTRAVASAMFCLSVIIFMAVVLYVPALSFAQVSNLHVFVTIVITGVICTIYCTIGGIKAVIWTDAVQLLILLVGLIALAIAGCVREGGGQAVWQIAMDSGRINFDDFSPDPRNRHTFWTQTLGQGVIILGLLSSNQMMVQRFMSVSTCRQAQGALYIAALMVIPLFILIVIVGLALHAAYVDCDPLVAKTIDQGDQILPYYLLDVLGEYRGVPGIIMASVFAAALSSVSSVINSLSAVFLEDFISPAVKHFKGVELSDRVRRWTAVVLGSARA